MDNRMRILFLERLFFKHTDESHALTIREIGVILSRYGYSDNKNTIRDDIEALQQSGLDIIHEKGKGYKLVSRLFDSSELKMLSDSIASYRFITVERSRDLIEKLKFFCSIHEAKFLQREFHIRNRIKSDNKQMLINIDAITTALREDRQFSFEYYDYDINRNLVYNGTRECSPWEMAICAEEYYVVSYYTKYPEHATNFRIDRMKNIHLTDDFRKKPPKEVDIGNYLKSSFSMFSGREEDVSLRFPMTNKMCNVIFDKFGYDTKIKTDGEGHYLITVPIKTEQPSAFFSWLTLADKPPKEVYIGNYLKSSFSMFSGREEDVSLRFPMTNKMCNVIFDKFGYDTKIKPDGEGHYLITVPIKTEQPSAFFSWLTLFEGKVQIVEPITFVWEF